MNLQNTRLEGPYRLRRDRLPYNLTYEHLPNMSKILQIQSSSKKYKSDNRKILAYKLKQGEFLF